MSSPAQKTIHRIHSFESIGKPIKFGRITVQLTAMPRSRRGQRVLTYRNRTTKVAQGEQFYPFKLGFRVVAWDPYFSYKELYKLMRFQLIFEKKVRFLNEFGELVDVKHNTFWVADHLKPLKELIQEAEMRDQEKPISVFI